MQPPEAADLLFMRKMNKLNAIDKINLIMGRKNEETIRRGSNS
jgi:hypothetical protein